jgi:hypothetical protein
MVNNSTGDLRIDFEQQNAEAKLLIQAGIEFQLHRCADGRVKGGGRAYFNIERSCDGVWIESSGQECKTPGKAREAFEALLNGYRVLERIQELDSTGNQIGEEAIGVKIMEGDKCRAIIAAYGATYCAVISAHSLKHLLAYREVRGF